MIDPYLLDSNKKLQNFLEERNEFDKKMKEYDSLPSINKSRLTAESKTTYLEFIDDIRQLWKQQDDQICDIIRAHSGEGAPQDVITFRLLHRKLSDDFKEYKPRLRETIPHPHRANETIDIFAQTFELLVEFKVYSSNAENADMLVIEFEEFIQRYTGHLKQAGVQEIIFKEQLEDTTKTGQRTETHERPLIYKIRLERLSVKYENEIEHISLQAKIYNQNKK